MSYSFALVPPTCNDLHVGGSAVHSLLQVPCRYTVVVFRDGTSQDLGHCIKYIRNKRFSAKMKIVYNQKRLEVRLNKKCCV